VPTDPGFMPCELPLLRLQALLARAHGDEDRYRDLIDRHRNKAAAAGFDTLAAATDSAVVLPTEDR
jgi:adenylate cyclase